jgi:hypothetical protein
VDVTGSAIFQSGEYVFNSAVHMPIILLRNIYIYIVTVCFHTELKKLMKDRYNKTKIA